MKTDQESQLVEVTEDSFDSFISTAGIVLVDCWAPSCGACPQFGPRYAKAAAKQDQHAFGKLNTVEQAKLARALGIVHVPTLMLFRDGVLLFMKAGNYDEQRLEDIISQAEAADMQAVRAKISAGVESEDASQANDSISTG